jgi:hypothetical protein
MISKKKFAIVSKQVASLKLSSDKIRHKYIPVQCTEEKLSGNFKPCVHLRSRLISKSEQAI